MPALTTRLITALPLLALAAIAQAPTSKIGQGWLAEFDHAASQTNALADATPADKFSWRPAPGVRSVAEVYMHLAIGNYFLLGQAGVKLPPEIVAQLKQGAEKSLTEKPAIIKFLKESQDRVRENYPKADRDRKTKFLGAETTVDGVYLRLLVHNHEHMGQSIAYARMIGVTPPWSQAPAQ